MIFVSSMVQCCPNRFVSPRPPNCPLKCLNFFNEDYGNKTKSTMRIIGNIDTSRYFLKITDGKVRINGKMVELTGVPQKMKSAACFTQVGTRTFASAYS